MASIFTNTPKVSVLDNRGLTVRDINYHRHAGMSAVLDERIICHGFSARGYLVHSSDPRFHDSGQVNFSYRYDLNGNVLHKQGVDNGASLSLNDAADRPLLIISPDNSHQYYHYERSNLPGRPTTITEQSQDGIVLITDRFIWAGNSAEEKALNLAGECVRHYDTAGLVQTDSLALTGVPLTVIRQLIKDTENPEALADWQGADDSSWNDQLDGESLTVLSTSDATGAVLTTTDAKGNMQRVAYNVAGQLKGSWLTLRGGTEQIIVRSLTYSAAGQKLQEVHGNGVVTTYTYEAETQRLTGIKTERPAGHAVGAKVLQDLRYEYDPVGNVLKVSNDAEETRFWRNQKVVPENRYIYDSLYQLVSASGREMANAGQQGSSLPDVCLPDNAAYTSYTRTYDYDSAGNLTKIRHSAPATNKSYTTKITVSDRSNRGVPDTLTDTPSEVDALYTAGGQQRKLLPGQELVWTPRNELLKVTPVVRDGGKDDRESYRYDGVSRRIQKVSVQNTGTVTQVHRVRYLPGLELRTTTTGTTEREVLQVIMVGEAGGAQVRILHWETGKPDGISNGQVRYNYDSLTGSCSLELDGEGRMISQEEYYPYGGTAILTGRSAVEAGYKTVRYSGKERDATGLYYYGYRYYQPWAGIWLSADPAGAVDGLNLFRMCRNNPVSLFDPDGEAPEKALMGEYLKQLPFWNQKIPEYGTRKNSESMNPKSDKRTSKMSKKFLTQFKGLEEHLQSKLQAIHIKETIYNKGYPQLEIPGKYIYRLSLVEEDAYILQPTTQDLSPVIPTGILTFVVLEEEPLSVYAFSHEEIKSDEELRRKVNGAVNYGHSSIAFKEDGIKTFFNNDRPLVKRLPLAAKPALIAGHAFFPDTDDPNRGGGVLKEWNNDSGHFKPSKFQNLGNRVGYVRKILPESKFKPISLN